MFTLLPFIVTYVLCARMYVCYGFFCLYLPILFLWFSPPPFEIQFHTPTHTHICPLFVDIIFRLLLSFCWFSFFFVFLFFVLSLLPLIFCGVCGCLPRQRLECNLCSLAKCWAFSAAASDSAPLLASRISFYAHPHLLPLVICVIYAYRNKQTRPSQAKPSV